MMSARPGPVVASESTTGPGRQTISWGLADPGVPEVRVGRVLGAHDLVGAGPQHEVFAVLDARHVIVEEALELLDILHLLLLVGLGHNLRRDLVLGRQA